jgi:hypothetical protein
VDSGASGQRLRPRPVPGATFATVEDYDAANAEASVIATEFETRAQKINGYVNTWERSTMMSKTDRSF